jgi:hypothetical protein
MDVRLPDRPLLDRPLRRALWGAAQGLFFGGLLYLVAVLGLSYPLAWVEAWPFLLGGAVLCAAGQLLARGVLGGCLGLLAGALLGSAVADETSPRRDLIRHHLNRQARLSGLTLAGTEYDIARRRGKVVVIAFWNPGQAASRREMGRLKKLYERHRGDGLEVVGVGVACSREELAACVRSEDLPWPQVAPDDGDEGAWENPLLYRYLVRSLPYTLVVDRKGKNVAAGLLGERLKGAVSETLAGKAPAPPLGSGFEEPWGLLGAVLGWLAGIGFERRLRRVPSGRPVPVPA